MILIVMGVCGSGKTTVGSCLGNKLGWTFYDADDYHPKGNIDKMSSGIPLNDQDRVPWLQILHDIIIREWSSGRNVILACSALKKLYRQIMAMGSEILDSVTDEEKFPRKDLLFVYLHGTIELITKRLAARKGHYMAENLIQSQFDVLEPPAEPENFITVEIAKAYPKLWLRLRMLFITMETVQVDCTERIAVMPAHTPHTNKLFYELLSEIK